MTCYECIRQRAKNRRKHMGKALKIIPIKIDKEHRVVLVEYNRKQTWQRIGNKFVEEFLEENIGKTVEIELGPNMKIYKKGTVRW